MELFKSIHSDDFKKYLLVIFINQIDCAKTSMHMPLETKAPPGEYISVSEVPTSWKTHVLKFRRSRKIFSKILYYFSIIAEIENSCASTCC